MLRRLADEARQARVKLRLVGVCLESQDTCEAYFKRHAVALDTTVGVSPDTLMVTGTPTLLLVNPSGKVAAIWRGLLTPAAERAVLEAVRANHASP